MSAGSDVIETLDEDRLLGMEPYEILDNRVVGQEFRLLEHESEGAEGYLRAEIRFRADATGFPEHVHPRQHETFKVLEGELVVAADGDEQVIGPGEQVTLPPGVPHHHENVSGTETRVLWEVRPPQATETFSRMLVECARTGNTDDEGTPNLLALAVFADAHPDFIYLPTPPIFVQKLLFRILAPLGRLRGYSADYPPHSHSAAR